MGRFIEESERRDWLDLSQRYHFLYGGYLEQRLVTQRADIMAWSRLGRGGPDAGRYRAPGRAHASVAAGETRRFAPPATVTRLHEEMTNGETPKD